MDDYRRFKNGTKKYFQNGAKDCLYFCFDKKDNFWRIDYTKSEDEKVHVSFLIKLSIIKKGEEKNLFGQSGACKYLAKELNLHTNRNTKFKVKIAKGKELKSIDIISGERIGLTKENDSNNSDLIIAYINKNYLEENYQIKIRAKCQTSKYKRYYKNALRKIRLLENKKIK